MPYWRPFVQEVKMGLTSVFCPHYQSAHIMKGGKTKAGMQRYKRLFRRRKSTTPPHCDNAHPVSLYP
jgi:hypothetical protein